MTPNFTSVEPTQSQTGPPLTLQTHLLTLQPQFQTVMPQMQTLQPEWTPPEFRTFSTVWQTLTFPPVLHTIPPQFETMPPPQQQTLPPPQFETMPPPQFQTLPPPQFETLPPPHLQTMPPPQLQTMPIPQLQTMPPTEKPNIHVIHAPSWGIVKPAPNPTINPDSTTIFLDSFPSLNESLMNISYMPSTLNDSYVNVSWSNASWTNQYDGIESLYPYEATLCFLGIILNVLSILALLKVRKPTRGTPFFLALRFISFTDLLFATTYFVYSLVMALTFAETSESFSKEKLGCWDEILLDLSRHCLVPPLFATTGIVAIQAISVFYPLKFPTMVNRRRLMLGMCLPLCFTVLVYLALHIGYAAAEQNGDHGQCWAHFYGGYLWSSTWYLALICSVLEVSTLVLYVSLWSKVKNIMKEETKISVTARAKGGQSPKKLHVTIGLLLATIILFWTPAVVTFFLMLSLKNETEFDVRVQGRFDAHQIAGLVALLNPIVDPVVYVVRMPEVRDGYRRVWRRVCCRFKNHLETGSSSKATSTTSHSKNRHGIRQTASNSV